MLSTTKKQSKDHAILSELYAAQMNIRLNELMEDLQRMYRRVRLHNIHNTLPYDLYNTWQYGLLCYRALVFPI